MEVVEVDKVLDVYLEEYIDAKKRIMKNLSKNYSRVLENEQGVFSFDDITAVIKDSVETQSVFAALRFPTVTSYTRVFLHALTSTKNKFDVAPKEFLSACSKYGIDSPFPLIRVSAFDTEELDNDE